MSAPTLSGVSLRDNYEDDVDDLPPVDEKPASFMQRGGPSFVGDGRDVGTGYSYAPPPTESTIRNGPNSVVGDPYMYKSTPNAPGLDDVVRDTKTQTGFVDPSSETKTPGFSDLVHKNQSDPYSGYGGTKTYKEVNPTQYFVEDDDEEDDDD